MTTAATFTGFSIHLARGESVTVESRSGATHEWISIEVGTTTVTIHGEPGESITPVVEALRNCRDLRATADQGAPEMEGVGA